MKKIIKPYEQQLLLIIDNFGNKFNKELKFNTSEKERIVNELISAGSKKIYFWDSNNLLDISVPNKTIGLRYFGIAFNEVFETFELEFKCKKEFYDIAKHVFDNHLKNEIFISFPNAYNKFLLRYSNELIAPIDTLNPTDYILKYVDDVDDVEDILIILYSIINLELDRDISHIAE